jgi:hypothetical protein
MVSQAEIKSTNGHNGGTELPPRAMARNAAEFFHDVTTLAELQGKLAILDVKEGFAKLLTPVILVCAGAAFVLGSVPIALMTLALTLEHTTTLSPPVCFAISLAVGLVVAGILIFSALGALKRGIRMFDRSMEEWRRNRHWATETLKRLGQTTSRPSFSGRW